MQTVFFPDFLSDLQHTKTNNVATQIQVQLSPSQSPALDERVFVIRFLLNIETTFEQLWLS